MSDNIFARIARGDITVEATENPDDSGMTDVLVSLVGVGTGESTISCTDGGTFNVDLVGTDGAIIGALGEVGGDPSADQRQAAGRGQRPCHELAA